MASPSAARGLLVRDHHDTLGVCAGGEGQRHVVGGSDPVEKHYLPAEGRESVARGLERRRELEWERIGREVSHQAAVEHVVRPCGMARGSQSGSISKLMSIAGAECVSAPTET